MNIQEEARRRLAATARAINERQAGLRDGLETLEAQGRRVWEKGNEVGVQLRGRTTGELRELGRAAREGRLPQVVLGKVSGGPNPPPKRAPATAVVHQPAPAKPRPASPSASAPTRQLQAGVSGAVDEFSFGLADRALAAGDALIQGGPAGFGDRYDSNMAEKRAEDAYDAHHHGAARNVGRVVGLGASLATMGGASALGRVALAGIPRTARLAALIAKAPRLKVGVDPRGLATLAASGGASAGIVGQGVGDAVSGRLSSVSDYAGAAPGGAVGGLTTVGRGPVVGGLVGGASTSSAQDLLNGRSVSAEHAIEAAHAGAVFAGATGALGEYGAAALPRKLKGDLGEVMSAAKTAARGIKPIERGRAQPTGRGKTIPDRYFRDNSILEAKMGPYADLSRQQKLAKWERENGIQRGEYIVDAWRFSDVGKAASAAGMPFGPQLTDEERFRWRLR